VTVVQLVVLSQIYLTKLWTTTKPSIKIVGVLVDIQTRDLPHASQKH